jgi:hypothetical protein
MQWEECQNSFQPLGCKTCHDVTEITATLLVNISSSVSCSWFASKSNLSEQMPERRDIFWDGTGVRDMQGYPRTESTFMPLFWARRPWRGGTSCYMNTLQNWIRCTDTKMLWCELHTLRHGRILSYNAILKWLDGSDLLGSAVNEPIGPRHLIWHTWSLKEYEMPSSEVHHSQQGDIPPPNPLGE